MTASIGDTVRHRASLRVGVVEHVNHPKGSDPVYIVRVPGSGICGWLETSIEVVKAAPLSGLFAEPADDA